MPDIELNDLDLYYEEYGKGDGILFLHSHFSRGVIAFEGQINAFSKHYRCLFPDFRGHGKTKCKSLEWNSRMLADDMANFIDKLNLGKVHLIGYSCGAYVCCYLASKYTDKVKSLITIGGGAYPRSEGAINYLPENLVKNNPDFVEEMKTRHKESHQGDFQTYLRMTVNDWQSHPSLSDDEWKSIKCPVLFINGENDPFGTCEELLEKVPHGDVFEVKGAGHCPHFSNQRADEVNSEILDFLCSIKEREKHDY